MYELVDVKNVNTCWQSILFWSGMHTTCLETKCMCFCFSGHHQMSLWGSQNEQVWTSNQWSSPDVTSREGSQVWCCLDVAGGSHVWCPGRAGARVSQIWYLVGLYCKIQCIMGNIHIGSSLQTEWWRDMNENITFLQFRWPEVNTKMQILVMDLTFFTAIFMWDRSNRTWWTEKNCTKLCKNSMFVNISSVMIACYPISEWEVPFHWEWLVRNSFKAITSFAYLQENLFISVQQVRSVMPWGKVFKMAQNTKHKPRTLWN